LKCTTSRVPCLAMKNAKMGRNSTSYSCRKSHAQMPSARFSKKVSQVCDRFPGGRARLTYF